MLRYDDRTAKVTGIRSIHATAPIRICDNGGWTDTWVARHGKVFNIAVRPLVTVRVDVFPHGSRGARVVLNVQDRGMRYAPDLHASSWGAHPLLEFGLDLHADVSGAWRPHDFGLQLDVQTPQGNFTVVLQVPGEHNARNALAAIAAGLKVVVVPDLKQPSEYVKAHSHQVITSLEDWLM